MSETNVSQDVKTEEVAQDVKTESVTSNEKAEEYTVPGYRFREINEEKKALEKQLSNLQAQQKTEAEEKMAEKQQYKELYETTKVERDQFAKDAESFKAIEQARKERILEEYPEELRSKLSKLDSDTLEQMKTEFSKQVPSVDNSGGGVSGGKQLEWSKISPSERKSHFADIMRGALKKG
jgi:glutamate synthase domain-containing protein 2